MHELLGTIQRHDSSSTITLSRFFRAAPNEVWDAVVDPARAGRWLGNLSGDLTVGGHYSIVFDETDPAARVDGRIVTCTPGVSLEVTWRAPGEQESRVHLTLTPKDPGTELVLIHSALRAPSSDTGHAAGWQVHLEQLATGLEHGTWVEQWETWAALERAYSNQLA